MKTFVRLSFIAISAFGLNSFTMAHENSIKGIRCFQDKRPVDGVLKEVALNLNSKDKYNVTLRIAVNGRGGAVTDKTVVLAEDLACAFSSEDPRVSACSKKGANGNNSGFSTTFTTTVGANIDGAVYKANSVNIYVHSPFIRDYSGSMISEDEIRGNLYKLIINFGGQYSKCEVLK